ncbi:hypothetical protein K2X96_00975 [Patescibacteria group bacterium]|nr:hypothetical protein [Patescibacteria group bacterium]
MVYGEEIIGEQSASPALVEDIQIRVDLSTNQDSQDVIFSDEVSEEDQQLVVKSSEEAPMAASIMAAASASEEESGTGYTPTVSSKQPSTKVSLEDGSLSYEYPITLPPGRGAVTPTLSLNYKSNVGADTDILGYGWSFSIPSIRRVSKTGIEDLYGENATFHSSLGGELVRIGTTTEYVSKIEKGDFLIYSFVDNVWTVTDKKGTRFQFGSSTASRQDNPDNKTQIATWMLDAVEDTNGNRTLYSYTKDSGMIYPERITYTHTKNTTGIFEVRFVFQKSQSENLSYTTAFPVIRKNLLSEIHVLVEGAQVRKYTLRYGTGMNEVRNTLLGIKEIGINGSEELPIPETAFGYGQSVAPSWSVDDTVDFPEPLDGTDIGVRFGDLNGDGLTDVIRYHRVADFDNSNYEDDYDRIIRRVSINKGDGKWDIDVPWGWDDIHTPFLFSSDGIVGSKWSHIDLGTRLIDLNADGLDDLIVTFGGPHGYDTEYNSPLPLGPQAVYINNGTGFVKDTEWTGIQPLADWHTDEEKFHYPARELIDINGDNLPDFVHSYFNTWNNGSPWANTVSEIKINTGKGWVASDLKMPASLGYQPNRHGVRDFADTGTRFADVNGDGLVDVLRGFREDNSLSKPTPELDERNVYLNTGNGWATTTSWNLPEEFIIPDLPTISQSLHIVDINGDKLPDIVRSRIHNNPVFKFYLNTGSGWKEKDYQLPFWLNQGYRAYSAGTALFDFNGDTLVDAAHLAYSGGDVRSTTTQMSGGHVTINESPLPDLLTEVLTDKGGHIAFSYDGYLDTAQQDPARLGKSPINPIVVSSIQFNSGRGNIWKESYSYSNPGYYVDPTNPFERKFSGFGSITKTDDRAKTTTYYHQGNGVDQMHYEGVDSENKIGLPYRSEVYDLSDTLFKREHTVWDERSVREKSAFVYPTKTLTSLYDGNSGHKSSAETRTFDDRGNLLKQTEWGEVRAANDGSWVDVAGDTRSTVYTYASSTDGRVRSSVSNTVLYNAANKVRAHTRYVYDNLKLGSVGAGNLTQQQDLVSTSTWALRKWSYTPEGLIATTTDQRGKTTSYIYDTHRLYPARITNPLGHAVSYEYDYSSGKNIKEVAINGDVYKTTYDLLDRPLSRTAPDPKTGLDVVVLEYKYNDQFNTVSETQIKKLSDTLSHVTVIHKDRLGRVVQERMSTENPAIEVARDFVYGENGERVRESLPYFAPKAGVDQVPETENEKLYISYKKDALGRIVSTKNALGTTEVSYDDWTETVIDPEEKKKVYSYDAFGRLSAVTEYVAKKAYTTKYEWGALQTLEKITDALGNIRIISYDNLGRRTSISDLHAPSDATFGVYTYEYDAAGNLIKEQNPAGEVTLYTYDALNRPLSEDYTSTPSVEVTYAYDACVGGKGRLCTATNTGAKTAYQYDKVGNLSLENRTIDGVTYTSSTTYDWQKNPIAILYPDKTVAKYQYNSENRIDKIIFEDATGSSTMLVSRIDYSPTGAPTYEVRGNGTTISYTYDPSALYRLTRILTKGLITSPASTLEKTFAPFENGDFAGVYATSSSLSLIPLPGIPHVSTTTSDFFTDTTKALELHRPNASSSWNRIATTTGARFIISNNELRLTASSTDKNTLYTLAPTHTAQEYSVELRNTATSTHKDDATHIIAHYIDPSNFYALSLYGNSATRDVVLRSKEKGVTKALKYNTKDIAPGDVFRMDALKEQINVYKNTTLLFSASTSIATTSQTGVVGIGAGNIMAPLERIATSTAWDNFKTGTLIPTTIYKAGAWTSKALPVGTLRNISSSSIAYTASATASSSIQVLTALNTKITPPSVASFKTVSSGAALPGIISGNNLAAQYLYARAQLTPNLDASVSPKLNGLSVTLASATTTQNQVVQDIRYTYDKVGNIASIVAIEPTGTYSTLKYQYDDLYRLTTASSTGNTEGDYLRTYAYDPLGNILSANDVGTYLYQGATGTSFANPHAATQIGSTTLAYDKKGNLASTSDKIAYTWDYNNRLTASLNGSTSVSYAYDHADSRTKKKVGAKTTIYPSKLYEITGATTTKHIYRGDALVASIEKVGSGAPTIGHAYLDHLRSTDLVIDQKGVIVEDLEYYPFGAQLSDVGKFNESNQYIGQNYDEETELSYLNARYYNGAQGQFMSQDPAFLDIGGPGFEQNYQRTLQQHLKNPQALNSYSYAHNNPITLKDPDGEVIPLILAGAWAAAEVGLSIYDGYNAYGTVNDPNATEFEKSVAVSGFAAGLIGPAGGYGSAGNKALQIYKQTNSSGQVLMKGVQNERVLNLIKDNYRAGAKIGNGSTADAIIHTARTNELVGNSTHIGKAENTLNRITNIFKKYGSELNSQETKALNKISNDLKNALKKTKK